VQRREFIRLVGVAAAASPLAGHAQQGDRVRRIGAIVAREGEDAEVSARLTAFQQGLQQLGWTAGRNVRIDIRWAGVNPSEIRKSVATLVGLAPDLILATGSLTLEPLLGATRTLPIVFVTVADPVGAGYVESLALPGGNATGFALFEYGLAGKWLELLKQIAPNMARTAVLRDGAIAYGSGQFAVIQSVAPSVGVDVTPINLREAPEIERAITAFVRRPDGGLIATAGQGSLIHRELIITLAARHKLPTIYWQRFYAMAGGLVSYGPDLHEQYRLAAGYVDRILKGEKPADLPVQVPTKYELVINLKTAKALGITIPPSILARAAEVIE
jgi:putative tryptophan/tyrosine transport system substrate-binding protein